MLKIVNTLFTQWAGKSWDTGTTKTFRGLDTGGAIPAGFSETCLNKYKCDKRNEIQSKIQGCLKKTPSSQAVSDQKLTWLDIKLQITVADPGREGGQRCTPSL